MLPVLCVLVACSVPEPSGRAAHHRLVDPEAREDARLIPVELEALLREDIDGGESPAIDLQGDRRLVLFAHPTSGMKQGRLKPSRRGWLELEIPLAERFSRAEAVVLRTRAKVGDLWIPWPASLHPVVELSSGERGLKTSLRHPLLRVPSQVLLVWEVFLAPPGGRTVYRTKPLEIPPGATLDLATGFVDASEDARVRLSVSFCEQGLPECLVLLEADSRVSSDRPWQPRSISLASVEGREGGLVFETALHAPDSAGFALPVWANPVVSAPTQDDGPSAILISLDTLRADHLSAYGYERETSPRLDAWAAKGTLFERGISAATRTEASHMSMFTSLLPSEHGTTQGLVPLAASVPTLAELLRAEGLATAAITENGPLAARLGFGNGFERYVENKSPNLRRPEGYIEQTLQSARDWLTFQRGRRFFLFLHTYQVHYPYDPPPEYRDLFGATERDERTVVEMRDDYDREIRYTDDVLAEFLDWLHEQGLDRNTFVIVTSDHGEEFLEHGEIGHDNLPYEELLHVPLIWRGPGVRRGRRVTQPVSHLDLAPTLLELMGADLPSHARGISYAHSLRDAEIPEPDGQRFVPSESWGKLEDEFEAPAHAVRRGSQKLIRLRRNGRQEYRFFDLATDPMESRDRSGDHPERVQELAAEIERLDQTAIKKEVERVPTLEVDPEREDKLRALGYIE